MVKLERSTDNLFIPISNSLATLAHERIMAAEEQSLSAMEEEEENSDSFAEIEIEPASQV